MMDINDLINRRRRRRPPSEEDLRRLPFRRAFVYGRVSKPEQVERSEQSIREIAEMVEVAKSDGYEAFLPKEEVERRISAIQRKQPGAVLQWDDGDVTVDCRDLGISGQLPEGKRPGLANLKQKLEEGEVGCVYLTEGMGRVSRDRDKVLSYQMLRILKEQQCRVRTPDGLWNAAIDRDWEYLEDELTDASDELKVMGKRLRRRRNNKAKQGRHVGCPVVAGFRVKIEGQRPDGRYILGKWEAYPPHAEVVNIVLRYLVRLRSPHRAAHALFKDGIVFPYFPDELRYMVTRTQLKTSPMTANGYIITPGLVRGLAQNPALIGVWTFSDQTTITDNHDRIVDEDLFWEACEIVSAERQPRGRTVEFDPLPFTDLLWCYDHPLPQRVSCHSSDGSYICKQDYNLGMGPICFDIGNQILDIPLLETILRQLDFTPYADQVLTELEAEYQAQKAESKYEEQQRAQIEKRISRLKTYLGSPDPEREETYWQMIKEEQARLETLCSHPVRKAPPAPPNIHRIRKLLANLKDNWEQYSTITRNQLLRIFIDRIELRSHDREVEASIVWKVGMRQTIVIQRPPRIGSCNPSLIWTEKEKETLRRLWPLASRNAILEALPHRSWQGIICEACKLGGRRPRQGRTAEVCRAWSEEEDAKLIEMYDRGDRLSVRLLTLPPLLRACTIMQEVHTSRLRLQPLLPIWGILLRQIICGITMPLWFPWRWMRGWGS